MESLIFKLVGSYTAHCFVQRLTIKDVMLPGTTIDTDIACSVAPVLYTLADYMRLTDAYKDEI